MRTIIIPRPALLGVVLLGVSLSSALLYSFDPNFTIFEDSALIGESIVVFPKREELKIGPPKHLMIPMISLDSAVENLGLAPSGAMDVPADRSNVGWFGLGLRPGNTGTAVIDGHYGIKDGKGSAFDNLHKLRVGDKVYVEDDKGFIITFLVREIKRYDPKAESNDIFGSSDGRSHLNLITCEGDWDNASNQYPKRLVVFTDREELVSTN